MIEQNLKKINANLKSFFDDVSKRYKLNLISDNLLSCSKEFVLRKGKRIRPLLFVLAYQGYSARSAKTTDNGLFKSAASIELLHDYMLIHDDVIDNSDVRRGKPTLHKLFDKKIRLADGAVVGTSLAIVAGDIIFALAIEAFLSISEDAKRKEKALRKLVETAAYTGAGEFIDVVFGHQRIQDLSERKIFLTYTLKTAKYTFECPLAMGAILAGAPSAELRKLSELGLCAGQAFQIYDDFLDLFASQSVIGKPILSDLAEAKKTLLILKAFKNLKGKERQDFQQIFEKKNKTYADLKKFRALVIRSGSYTQCLKQMTSLQQNAVRICKRLKMKPAQKKELEDIILKLSPSQMPFQI